MNEVNDANDEASRVELANEFLCNKITMYQDLLLTAINENAVKTYMLNLNFWLEYSDEGR